MYLKSMYIETDRLINSFTKRIKKGVESKLKEKHEDLSPHFLNGLKKHAHVTRNSHISCESLVLFVGNYSD